MALDSSTSSAVPIGALERLADLQQSVSGSAGLVTTKIIPAHCEYVLMTRSDILEAQTLGWFQQGLFGVGMFFFGGAFWLLVSLCATSPTGTFSAWMAMCILSMTFGTLLMGVGGALFWLKQRKLSQRFDQGPRTVSS